MVESEQNDGASVWHARAAACELLALSLRYPDAALVDIVCSEEWSEAAGEIWGALGIDLENDWAPAAGGLDLFTLHIEATRLFVGHPHAACSPYEGFWRAGDDGVQPLLFVNPHTVEVERFCKSCGLGQPEKTNEPLDHIATEFELLQYLAAVEAGIGVLFEGGPLVEDLPGGGAGAAYEIFMADHVLSFAPRLALLLENETRIPFYHNVAKLLVTYLEREQLRLQGVV